MAVKDNKWRQLPEFPRTRHLPWKVNAQTGDVISTDAEANVIFTSPRLSIEEKVDGANCGMGIDDGHPAIRNRNHVIHKGFCGKTPAKMQFGSVWNWWHDNIHLFQKLSEHGPYSVYGEWCVAQHGLNYDLLPSWFIAHTLYDYEKELWVDTQIARQVLESSGFSLVPLLHWGTVTDYAQLEQLSLSSTAFARNSLCEGIYLKICNGVSITHNFKMVRSDFVQGGLWSATEINKNKLKK